MPNQYTTPPVTRSCDQCGLAFRVRPSDTERRFCSRACYAVTQRAGEQRDCPICGIRFYARRTDIREGKGIFCSPACFNVGRTRGAAHHFWRRVEKTDGCWLWRGIKNRKGYGMFTSQHRTRGAHRWAWELTHGPIPDGLHVLHRCDNRACVNPDHLFLGTNADNMLDMIMKGRAGVLTRPVPTTVSLE